MLNKCSPPEKGGGCSSGGSLASKARETGGRRQKGKRDREKASEAPFGPFGSRHTGTSEFTPNFSVVKTINSFL